MTAELYRYQERYDSVVYDTETVEGGKHYRFFGSPAIGLTHVTNMRFAGFFGHNKTFIIGSIGARLLGTTKDEEDVLLDHIAMRIVLGDKPYPIVMGPVASMLRELYAKEDAEELERVVDMPPETDERYRLTDKLYPAHFGYMGAHLSRPIMIPTRLGFCVEVDVSQSLPRPVDLRVHLFGLETRDVQ